MFIKIGNDDSIQLSRICSIKIKGDRIMVFSGSSLDCHSYEGMEAVFRLDSPEGSALYAWNMDCMPIRLDVDRHAFDVVAWHRQQPSFLHGKGDQ